MYLSKRNGIFYLWYINPATKKKSKVSTGSASKSDAYQFLRQFNLQQRLIESKSLQYTLAIFKEEYLNYSISAHTHKTYLNNKISLEQMYKFMGDVLLKDIGIQDIEKFLAYKIKNTSRWTGKKLYAHLASAFQRAVVWEKLSTNPFRKVTKPKTPEMIPKYFTIDDLAKLLEVVDDQLFKDIIVLAVSTGMRLGEVVNLQWGHIDFQRKQLIVQNTNLFNTKSKRNRRIPISNDLFPILAKMERRSQCDFVFHSDGKQLRPDYVTKKFKRFVRSSNIDKTLHFHSLRHSTASLLVQANVPIYTVKEIMGHSQITTTMIYSHLSESHLQDSINNITFPQMIPTQQPPSEDEGTL
jgi:integrase